MGSSPLHVIIMLHWHSHNFVTKDPKQLTLYRLRVYIGLHKLGAHVLHFHVILCHFVRDEEETILDVLAVLPR